MIHVVVPDGNIEEKQYVFDVVLNDFLGLNYTFEVGGDVYRISVASKEITFEDHFFGRLAGEESYLSEKHIPKAVKKSTCFKDLIILFGLDHIRRTTSGIHWGVDFVATVYFMLSRWEEVVGEKKKDSFDRFSAKQSLAFQCGFLETPLVDQYVEVLWGLLLELDPSLVRKERKAKTFVTCDVDTPYLCTSRSLQKTLRVLGGDLLKRRSLKAAGRTLYLFLQAQVGFFSDDPYMKDLRWMMKTNESLGKSVAFYFIPDTKNPQFDACYKLQDKVILDLFKEMSERGHELGVHPSFESYNDEAQLRKELTNFRDALKNLEIHQNQFGGRQHYLRWNFLTTPQALESAGSSYDSTMGYADHAGFRCGTSHDFPMFDLKARKKLTIRQRPLILMEASVVDPAYMNLGFTEESLSYMLGLKQKCYEYGGTFTLLWHNSYFPNAESKRFYQELIK